MTKLLTNSEMQTWRDCRRRWWLSYFRGLRRKGRGERFNTAIAIGNRVHAALDAFYDPTDECSDPVQHAKDACDHDASEHPEAKDDVTKERELVATMLEGYVEWLAEEGPDSDYEPVEGTEEAVQVPIADDLALLAKMDVRLVDRVDGGRWTMDYKTGTSGTEPALLQLNTQALTQHLIEFLRLKAAGAEAETAKGTVFSFLKKVKRTARAKPPFYWRDVVRHSPRELESHWKHVVAIASDIRTAEWRLRNGEDHHAVAYPSPTKDCTWKCAFFRVCSQFDDGSDVEGALSELYETGDPLERYASSE